MKNGQNLYVVMSSVVDNENEATFDKKNMTNNFDQIECTFEVENEF